MSRRDIETVATLAAHLARVDVIESKPGEAYKLVARVASDAMALQRLGSRARRLIDRGYARGPYGHHQRDKYEETLDIIGIGNNLLKPYGLSCEVQDLPFDERALIIVGLPCNGLNTQNGQHELGTVNGVNTFREGFAI